MKPRTKLFIFSAILMTTTLIIGCGKPQELTSALKTEVKAKTEIKDREVTVMVKNGPDKSSSQGVPGRRQDLIQRSNTNTCGKMSGMS